MAAGVDPKVVEIVERHGFQRHPTDTQNVRWMDECGHVLTETQLAHETPETIHDLIEWMHDKVKR